MISSAVSLRLSHSLFAPTRGMVWGVRAHRVGAIWGSQGSSSAALAPLGTMASFSAPSASPFSPLPSSDYKYILHARALCRTHRRHQKKSTSASAGVLGRGLLATGLAAAVFGLANGIPSCRCDDSEGKPVAEEEEEEEVSNLYSHPRSEYTKFIIFLSISLCRCRLAPRFSPTSSRGCYRHSAA